MGRVLQPAGLSTGLSEAARDAGRISRNVPEAGKLREKKVLGS